MSAPRVTVLIDTFNYGQYIEGSAVESVLAARISTLSSVKFGLVVDDGSTDDTSERLQKYGDTIRHLRKSNGGQASAFNFRFAESAVKLSPRWMRTFIFVDATKTSGARVRDFCEKPRSWHGLPSVAYVARWTRSSSGQPFFPKFRATSQRTRVSLLRAIQWALATSCLAFSTKHAEQIVADTGSSFGHRRTCVSHRSRYSLSLRSNRSSRIFLQQYRIHGANPISRWRGQSFGSEAHRNTATGYPCGLAGEIRVWLERNGNQIWVLPNLQAYMKQWTKSSRKCRCWASRSKNRVLAGSISVTSLNILASTARSCLPNIVSTSYVRALGALLLGYDRLHILT